ncbi:AMP-binding protein [Phytomonospora endophytica]|uniref:Nonribosomal peptide synthetase MxcG n=1 Tax=Phytomonospora endophytica TaxID=714109 RepID=A0A841F7F9_9ACTN|nr:AMP-binding protein [Phytomonospora endophytica]MBB6032961.1 nonribosomal peptide synthetase MxcG [Phytomonospora endophytica]GIG65187.1 hypothetical protein Pen01_14820 [Phytomonospora endophytica]
MRATQAQLGILTGQRLDPASPAYATAEVVELRDADAGRLSGAIAATVARTEALHCRFEGDRQRIGTAPPGWSPSIVDLGGTADPWPLLRAHIDADLAVPMDPATGPLFAHTLYLAGERVYWYQRVHHVALDGYGYVLFARAVAEHYNGGKTPGFAPLADLVSADTAYQAAERRERDREYWTGALADREPVRGLADGVAPPSYTNIRVTATVTGAAKSRLDEAGPAWPHVALAAVAAHTHRVTGSREVTLGLPVANRLGTPAARVPAMVMNIVPVPLTVDPAAGLGALVTGVAARLRESRRHQHYRYEHLRRDLGLLGGNKRMWGPVVNIIPFTEDLRFGDDLAVTHAITAGPVDDLSVTMRGPAELVVEANPALYTPAELRAHADGILERLADNGTVGEWSELPGTPAPEIRPVLERIRAHADADPDRIAIVDGDNEVSYGALWKMAGMNADNLARKGVGEGDLVGLAWPRGHGAVSVMLAALRSNAAFLPLDADGPAERNGAILAEARPRVVVGGRLVGEPAPPARDEPAYVIYTSGSTGRPNGVRVGRAALDFFVSAALDRYGITADDRVLQFAPLHFDAAVEEIFTTLAAGATLVVRDDSALESLAAFTAFAGAQGITVLDLPTAYWHELAYALHTGTARLPPSVRTVIIGGEAALPERVAQWFAAAGDGVRLINTYGPTEATVVALAADLSEEDGRSEYVPIGRPLPGVVAVRGPGDELHLGGPGLALGYLEQLELTGARFIGVGERRLYRSGDRVRVHDRTGGLAYIGRVDDELKISGHRIHPTEVEGALLAHPRVREVAVIARSSHGRSRLIAYVAADAPVEELREHAATRLTGPAVPQVVMLDRLPRTGTGKIDRRALSRLADPAAAEVAGTPEEKLVAAAWSEVLGRPVGDPGADFFTLGGQSLQAVAVASRLSAALGRTVPATLLFQHPTVSGLAAALSAPGAGPAADTMLADAEAPLPHPAPTAVGDRVLLTGATGFVGAHLLAELCGEDTEIWCTVRGSAERLTATAAAYGLPDPAKRVTPVPIDLGTGETLPELAFTRIWHAAATVSLTRGYASMRAANVEATRRILDLACRRGSAVHHVSTVAVGAGLAELPEDFVPAHGGLRDGYQRGKWAAERLAARAAAAGLPVTVYRLGRVTGPIARPHVNPADLVWRLVRAGLAVGSLPDLDVDEPWTPVDWVAEAAVWTAATGRTGVVNLVAETPTSLREVWRWIAEERGLSVEPLPVWRERVVACGDPEHLATAAFFATHGGGGRAPVIHSGPLPVSAPAVGRAVVLGYLSALTSDGGPAGG